MSLAYTIAYARKTATNTTINGFRLTSFAAPPEPLVGPDRSSGGTVLDRIGGSRWTTSANHGCSTRDDAAYGSLLSHLRAKNLTGVTA